MCSEFIKSLGCLLTSTIGTGTYSVLKARAIALGSTHLLLRAQVVKQSLAVMRHS